MDVERPRGGYEIQRYHVLDDRDFWALVDTLKSDIPIRATMTDNHYPRPVEMDGSLSMSNLRKVQLNVEADRVDPELPAWMTPSFSKDGKPTAAFKAVSKDGRYAIESDDLRPHGQTGFLPEGTIEGEDGRIRIDGQVTRDGWSMTPETIRISTSTEDHKCYVAYAVTGICDFMFDQIDTPYGPMRLFSEGRGGPTLCWMIIEVEASRLQECREYIERFYKMCAFGWNDQVQAVHRVTCDGHEMSVVSQPIWYDHPKLTFGMCEVYGRGKVLQLFADAAVNADLSEIVQRASMWHTSESTFLNSSAIQAFVCLEYLTYALHTLFRWCKPLDERMSRMAQALGIQINDLSLGDKPFEKIVKARNELVHRGNPDHLTVLEFVSLIHDANTIIERIVLALATNHTATRLPPRPNNP